MDSIAAIRPPLQIMPTLTYDRPLNISVANSRKATHWLDRRVWCTELIGELSNPVRGTETLAEYLHLPKSKQDELKDVGGFVGGTLAGNRRKAGNILGRDIVTLDLDNIPPSGTTDVLRRLDGLGCFYIVYSTRKHEEAKPRLRVLVPTNRTATADEYEPVARKIGAIIGIELCDPTTFEASRLMYFPSCSADSQYVFHYGDKPFLDVDGVLAMYQNWRDISEWPQAPGVEHLHARPGAKQGKPTEKSGVIGAFCRVYNVYQAIDTFLAGVYEPLDDGSSRYTFTGGSTAGGALVHDDGDFLYSHHATDPVSGRLVNAFDLVRIHKFSELDADAKPDTPVNKLPSFAAMTELALKDPLITEILDRDRYERVVEDFKDIPADETNTSWMRFLDRNQNGIPTKTIRNVQVVLEHDALLKGRIYKDSFADRLMGTAPLPWGARRNQTGPFQWSDDDDDGLLIYIAKLIGMEGSRAIGSVLRDHAAAHQRNPLMEYLLGVQWDGTCRVDNLYRDYLGADDHPYTRTVARKSLVAAVARVMDPGVKFDYMTVVSGPQGIGKSTLFTKLGKTWFTDSIKTFEGKDAEELIQGKWIVEIAELQAFNRTDIRRVKQFLSKLDDQYRAAYGRHVKKQIRRCVFFGTTNDHDYLSDPTGNRRFWPVDAMTQPPRKSVFNDLTDTEIDQIWAEAVMYWRAGEPLFLSNAMEAEAENRRQTHFESDPREGLIRDFIQKPVPVDWGKRSLSERRLYWSNEFNQPEGETTKRDKVCAAEIWCECLGGDYKFIRQADTREINRILSRIPELERMKTSSRFGPYGLQRGFGRRLQLP